CCPWGFGRTHTPPCASSSRDSTASTPIVPSLPDAQEVVVMIRGVVELAPRSPDDAPCAAAALAGGLHRVLAIIAAALLGQQGLAVAEDRAVLRVRVGAALADDGDGVARFLRQVGRVDLADRARRALRV